MIASLTGVVLDGSGSAAQTPQPLILARGEHALYTATITTQAGAAFNLTGYSLTLTVKTKDGVLLLQRAGVITNAAGGVATFELTRVDTYLAAVDRYEYGVMITEIATGKDYAVIPESLFAIQDAVVDLSAPVTPAAGAVSLIGVPSPLVAYDLLRVKSDASGLEWTSRFDAVSTYGTATWGALTGNATEQNYHTWAPSTAGASTWYIWGQSALNSDGTTYNHVHHEGWNVAAGGGRVDLTKPSFNFTLESNYWVNSRFQGEIHIESTDLSGVLHRFISIEAPHSGTGSNLLIKTDQGQIGTDTVGLASWDGTQFNIVSPNTIFKVSVANSAVVIENQFPSGGVYPRVAVEVSAVFVGGPLLSDYNNGGLVQPYDIGSQGSPWGAVCARAHQCVDNGALPTADAAHEGQLRMVAGGAGVASVVYACLKSAADTYSWKTVSTG